MKKYNNAGELWTEKKKNNKTLHEGMGRNVYTAILEIVISNTAAQITEHKYIHTQN